MRDLKQTEVAELLEALLVTGLLEQVETQRFRPMIQVTMRGAGVMRGESEMPPSFPLAPALRAKLSKRPKSAAVEPAETPAIRQAPMVRDKAPTPEADFEAGFQVPTDEPFEPDWSELAREEERAISASPRTPDPCEKPSHYWTWRLAEQGFSEAEIAAIRRLDQAEVRRHLEAAKRES